MLSLKYHLCILGPQNLKKSGPQTLPNMEGLPPVLSNPYTTPNYLGVEYGDVVSPPHCGKDLVPSQDFCFHFLVSKCVFWCILIPFWVLNCFCTVTRPGPDLDLNWVPVLLPSPGWSRICQEGGPWRARSTARAYNGVLPSGAGLKPPEAENFLSIFVQKNQD